MTDLSKKTKDKIAAMIADGFSQRDVAEKLSVSRYQVRLVYESLKHEKQLRAEDQKNQAGLLDYRDEIISWSAEKEMSAFLITRRLKGKGVKTSESSVKRLLQQAKKEVYLPMVSQPGEEAQVDFGYLGKFKNGDKMTKVWAFCMVLSFSRYAYYTLTTQQTTHEFMRCHQEAFEFFQGVPKSVKIDNLSAAVQEPDTFQPLINNYYQDFIDYYKTNIITCRIYRGQDKGKVESGIKYVKNNFLKSITHNDFTKLKQDLTQWLKIECNLRKHGTTRKIPQDQFIQCEKKTLISLPEKPFLIIERSERNVNKYGHIFFERNFYSVPSHFAGQKVIVEGDGKRIRIFHGSKMIASHQISHEQGNYITEEQHKPLYKQAKGEQYYLETVSKIGSNAVRLLQLMVVEKPMHWKHMINGVIRLTRAYVPRLVDLACEKALDDAKHQYQYVKHVLAKKLYRKELPAPRYPKNVNGYYHDLDIYDAIASGNLRNKY